ncbi:hypothetical protein Nepgr_005118 [Nepenthes gracilis]|uniref:Signal peptidase complex catalytic subunit SEC11 n=1 Tax=Nepenthes gracilis TaxID=150966 RepID=A0AAD3S319_NEPGR|nr:hypothetical protein Nepgr_005118 [Nepenthes gracilis]
MWKDVVRSIRAVQMRPAAAQMISLGVILTSALMLWKLLICLTGSESPLVVVLTGSMEPGFKRGDVLLLHMNKSPIQCGEIVVFNVEGRDIPIVHRVIKVHNQRETRDINILTKGDNNPVDDHYGRIYADGQRWVERDHVIGRVTGYLPYAGWATIVMTEKPLIKYLVIGALSLLVITTK